MYIKRHRFSQSSLSSLKALSLNYLSLHLLPFFILVPLSLCSFPALSLYVSVCSRYQLSFSALSIFLVLWTELNLEECQILYKMFLVLLWDERPWIQILLWSVHRLYGRNWQSRKICQGKTFHAHWKVYARVKI